MSTNPDKVLVNARWEFVWSYVHKIALVALAGLGFLALGWLGGRSDRYVKRWTLDAASVKAVADEGSQIVKAATQTNDTATAALAEATRAIDVVAAGLEEKPLGPYASKTEVITALEQRVDAHIWGTGMASIRNRIEPATGSPSVELDRIIAQEEAWVRARIAAAHAVIAAAAPKLQKSNDKVAPWESMFDSSRPYYVIFQIIWFALLLMSVLCLSMLALTLFAALPFTSAESYWTKRITEILGGVVPGAVAKVAAPMLASALIAGAVVAPAMYATAPGGISRETAQIRERIERQERQTINNVEGAKTDQTINQYGGDVNDWVIYDNSLSQTTFNTRMGDLDRSVRVLPGRVDRRVQTTLDLFIQRLPRNDAALADLTAAYTRLSERVGVVEDGVAQNLDLTENTFTAVGRVAEDQRTFRTEFENAAEGITASQQQLHELSSGDRLQAIEADGRSYFLRSFGPTHFHVGPVVAETFLARLGGRFADREFLDALQAQKPMDRWAFETMLRNEMAGRHFTAAEIDDFMTAHFDQLLNVTALRRS